MPSVPRGARAGPMMTAGIVLGLSLGGFLDGILFHQILQWHHMLTSSPNEAVANDIALNTLADGLFHAATWVLALVGLTLLWRAWRTPDAAKGARLFAGSLLMGAGLFNLVEGLVNHHVLGIHHVHPSSALVWDLAFLGVGGALAAVGWRLARARDIRDAASRERTRQAGGT